ncbi:MAG: DUF835 domain-containing protein [Thermoplasmata archaeon]|nr:DUF835 domain-containing protein [Thermoplasmata archaeon]
MQKDYPSVVDILNADDLVEGCAYLVEEKRPRHCIEMCEKFSAEGASLLIVSRDPPTKLVENTQLRPRRTIWVTTIIGENNLEPTAIGLLMNEIRKFIDQWGKKAVVLMDGLEYLISINTYERMLQFVHQMRDICVMSSSVLIIPIDPRTLNEKERALLERNLQVIMTASSREETASERLIHISSEEDIGV